MVSSSQYSNYSDGSVFHVQRDSRFLWTLQEEINIRSSAEVAVGSQEIMASLSPVFSQSDKSVPVLTALVLLLGDKVSATSIFQTVSLLYLVNFMALDASYNSFRQVISAIFIFQPKPLF